MGGAWKPRRRRADRGRTPDSSRESCRDLGVLDLGEDEDVAPDPEFDGAGPSLALRLTARGRALLADREIVTETADSKFVDAHVLRIGSATRIEAILALAPFVEVGRVLDTLDLVIAPQMLARALSAGVDAQVLRARVEAVGSLPDSLSRTLAQASVVVGRGTWIGAGGLRLD